MNSFTQIYTNYETFLICTEYVEDFLILIASFLSSLKPSIRYTLVVVFAKKIQFFLFCCIFKWHEPC